MVSGWAGMTCLELGDMLPVGLPTGGQAALLNGVDNPLNVGGAQDGGGLALDIADQAATHDVLRHGGLEGAVANKIDDGMQLVIRQPQQGFEGHQVQIVLMQRVLKAVPASKQLLGPALVSGITEDPPLHVFGFYHEYPEAGDDHLIDLGAALLERQSDIAQQMIFLPVEKEPDAEIEQPLPDHALEPGALGDGGQQQQWQQQPELVQQNGHQGGNVHVISPRSRCLSLATGHSYGVSLVWHHRIGAIRKMGCRSELL